MQLGMIGLGRMGGNMAERLRRRGHDVIGYDRDESVSQVPSLEELVERLDAPRHVWVMVPSGDPTRATITELAGLLARGDVVVDGGNSKYTNSQEHGQRLAERGIGFIDAGVSGGVWGLENGYALMVGGSDDDVARLQPIFDDLSPEDGGFVHAGPVGAGHFTKMVHNGVEYALMQAYAEGFELLSASTLGIDVKGALESWRHGSVVRSWLLDLLVEALEKRPGLEGLRGYAQDSGEGRWTVQEAVDLAVPAPTIAAALFARFTSRQDESPAMQVIAALREQFGGHAVEVDQPQASGQD